MTECGVLAVDHVLIAVVDLDDGAEHLLSTFGLGSVVGGRHDGQGTANRIVPLGDSYLELIAVVDEREADASPLGTITRGRAESDGGYLGVCLRTDDLDGVADRLGLVPLAMERTNARGETVAWRLAGLDRAITDDLPFFIEWEPDAPHPGREPVTHSVEVGGIVRVEVPVDGATLRAWVEDDGLGLRAVPGRPGRVVVSVSGREVVLP